MSRQSAPRAVACGRSSSGEASVVDLPAEEARTDLPLCVGSVHPVSPLLLLLTLLAGLEHAEDRRPAQGDPELGRAGLRERGTPGASQAWAR